jgi:hypothetical protein
MPQPSSKATDIPAGWEEVPDAKSARPQKAAATDIPAGWEEVPVDKPAPHTFQLPSARELAIQGVKVAGKNAAGQPILAPANDAPSYPRLLYRAMKTRVDPGAIIPEKFQLSPYIEAEDQALTSIHNVGARGIQGVESMVRHPINTAAGMLAMAKEFWDLPKEIGDPNVRGPLKQRIEEFQRDYKTNPRMAIENAAGDVLGLYLSGKLIDLTVGGVELPDAAGIPKPLRGKTIPGLKSLPPVKAVRKYVTETAPVRAIAGLIKPSAADVKFGKEPARAILDEGIVGRDLRELGDKTYDRLHEIGRQMDQLVRDQAKARQAQGLPPVIVDAKQSLRPLAVAIVMATKAGDVGLYDRLVNLRTELTGEYRQVQDPQGNWSLERVGDRNMNMSPEDALEFKRVVGDRVRWTGNDPFENAANEALGKMYGNLKDEVNKAAPGLKELNERYSNLVGAGKAIERRVPIEERNAMWHLSDIVLGSTGHLPVAIARRVISYPAVKTRIARGAYGMRAGVPTAAPPPWAPSLPGASGYTRMAAASSALQQPTQPIRTLAELKAEMLRRKPVSVQPQPRAVQPAPGAGSASVPPAATSQSKASSFAKAISSAEGYGTPGTIPTLANNPGALELGDVGHGVMQAANGQKITIFGSAQEGWDALNNQINQIYTGKSKRYSTPMTLERFGTIYSGGDTGYGARIAGSLGVAPKATLGQLVGAAQQP